MLWFDYPISFSMMSKEGIFGTNLKVCLIYDSVQYSYLFYLRIVSMLMYAIYSDDVLNLLYDLMICFEL